MRITHLTVENFRSIRKLELKDIPDVAVFYGENGTGKSNILRAVHLAWECVAAAAGGRAVAARPDAPLGTTLTPRLAIEVEFGSDSFRARGWTTEAVSLDCHVDGSGTVILQSLTATLVDTSGRAKVFSRPADQQLFTELAKLNGNSPAVQMYGEWLSALTATQANRFTRITDPREREKRAAGDADVPELAALGEIETAAMRAVTDPDAEMPERLERFLQLMQTELRRDRGRAVSLLGGVAALQEVRKVHGRAVGFPLESLGLGARHLYSIVGAVILSGARVVAIDEPEAHLHAPTSGRALRGLLLKLLPDPVHQLFVATHSEQFDLNPEGFYEVTWTEEEGTKAEWRTDLVDLDRRHTYSPGAARHALLEALEGDLDSVVYTRPDGSTVTAAEMVQLLVRDAPEAYEYLTLVTEAAVRAVAVRARREAAKG